MSCLFVCYDIVHKTQQLCYLEHCTYHLDEDDLLYIVGYITVLLIIKMYF